LRVLFADLRANKDIAFPKFSEQLTVIKLILKLTEAIKYTYLTVSLLRNMSDPDSIIGYEVGYSLIDETDILSRTNESGFL
jgi:hypothetical protein